MVPRVPGSQKSGAMVCFKESCLFPHFREIFVNNATGELWKKGETYKRPTLAKTLRAVAEKGADEFYKGEVAKELIKDLEELNSIITSEDLANYK